MGCQFMAPRPLTPPACGPACRGPPPRLTSAGPDSSELGIDTQAWIVNSWPAACLRHQHAVQLVGIRRLRHGVLTAGHAVEVKLGEGVVEADHPHRTVRVDHVQNLERAVLAN